MCWWNSRSRASMRATLLWWVNKTPNEGADWASIRRLSSLFQHRQTDLIFFHISDVYLFYCIPRVAFAYGPDSLKLPFGAYPPVAFRGSLHHRRFDDSLSGQHHRMESRLQDPLGPSYSFIGPLALGVGLFLSSRRYAQHPPLPARSSHSPSLTTSPSTSLCSLAPFPLYLSLFRPLLHFLFTARGASGVAAFSRLTALYRFFCHLLRPPSSCPVPSVLVGPVPSS